MSKTEVESENLKLIDLFFLSPISISALFVCFATVLKFAIKDNTNPNLIENYVAQINEDIQV